MVRKIFHVGPWVRKNFYVVTWSIDFAMLPIFLVCAVTGILMFPGFLDMMHVRARNFPFETVKFLHDWSGLSLAAGVLLHLGLHWRPTLQFLRNKVLHIPPKHRKPQHSIEEDREGVLL